MKHAFGWRRTLLLVIVWLRCHTRVPNVGVSALVDIKLW